MQPRSLNQIVKELNKTFNPQVESVRARQALIPQQLQAEEAGLGAKQEQAFGNILSGARRRGLGFSGIPLGEQAQYTSTEYLPALARLRQSSREQSMSLEDAILGILERRDTLAQQVRQQEVSAAEQRRQFEANLKLERERLAAQQRAARAGGGGGWSPVSGGGAGAASASFTRKSDGGFAFTNAKGQPISAAKYAQQTGSDIRDVLRQMGQQGDAYAAQLYNQLRNPVNFRDFQKRPNVYKQMYSPIFWGT